MENRLAELVVEIKELKEEVALGKQERQLLAQENHELKAHVLHLEKLVDNNEQYGRRNCLVLSGEDLPPDASEAGVPEDPDQTKKVVEEVIKNKLGVKLNGKILACHRLRKKDRAVVKFEDILDREKVYDARFPKEGKPRHKVVIQENLTHKRAKQVHQLSAMKRRELIGSYHTRNGNIYARAGRDQRFVPIDPDWNENEICQAVHDAPHRHESIPREQFGRSQTLRNIPSGHVASRLHDLEEFVVDRPTRRRKPGSSSQQQAPAHRD